MATKLVHLTCPKCKHKWIARLEPRQVERVCVTCGHKWLAKGAKK